MLADPSQRTAKSDVEPPAADRAMLALQYLIAIAAAAAALLLASLR